MPVRLDFEGLAGLIISNHSCASVPPIPEKDSLTGKNETLKCYIECALDSLARVFSLPNASEMSNKPGPMVEPVSATLITCM